MATLKAERLVRRTLYRKLASHPTSSRYFHQTAAWAANYRAFKLADIGEGITECEIIKWSAQPAQTVQAFDPLCEVQSDKASVELTSPYAGIIKEIYVQEGQVARVGEDLCLLEVSDEDADPDAVAQQDEVHTQSEPKPESQAQVRAESAEMNEIEPLDPTTEPPLPPPSATATQSSEPDRMRQLHPLDPRAQTDSGLGTFTALTTPETNPSVLALPSVRHFAKQVGIDLGLLAPGSGKGGRVEKKDIEAHLAAAKSSKAAKGTERVEEDVVVELSRTRHAMWKAMERSLEIPHFGYSTEIDLTKLHAMLPIFNANIPAHYRLNPPPEKQMMVNPAAIYPLQSPPDVPETGKYERLTYLPFLMKMLARAMQDWPLFRSSITSSTTNSGSTNTNAKPKPTLTVRPHADISIALSTPTGLYTPTLTRTDTLSTYALASHLAHLSSLGRRTPCALTPREMPKSGGTLTLSNIGSVAPGARFAHPVLVPGGGVAIAAIGRAVWVRDEERGGERRLKAGVSWSADHRVVEGAELAAFVECWRGYVENPERMIAEGV